MIDTKLDARLAIIEALRIATKYDLYVDAPFILIDTKSLEFEINVAQASLERTRGKPTIERFKKAFSDLNIIRMQQNIVLTIDIEALKFKKLNINK